MDKSVIDNRYRIIKTIGQGGMGLVYLVEDTLKDNLPFALKTIKADILKQVKDISIESFKNEYEIMTRLKHPNLTRVYEFGEYRENYYIIMEYLDGVLLSDNIYSHDQGKLKEKLDIMVQILRALEYIHSRNIIYRDIKPGNIMILKDKVKLMDFGLSGFLGRKEEKVKGTLLYIAPEVLSGDISFSADIFSLGIVFYEMTTGIRFYHESDLSAYSLINLLKDNTEFKTFQINRAKRVSDRNLAHIIEKMTSGKEKRYRTCSEIIHDINILFDYNYELETEETKESYLLGNTFANRKSEMKNLIDNIDSGDPKLFMIYSGTSGIGKTRLFHEFKKYCRLNLICFFEANCMESEIRAFMVIGQIISQLMHHASNKLIKKYGNYLKFILPNNSNLNSFEIPNIIDDPKKLQDLVIQNISDFIMGFAKEIKIKLIFYFNDMQWMDLGSELIIRNLIHRIRSVKEIKSQLFFYGNINENRLPRNANIKNIYSLEGVIKQELSPLDIKGVREYIENIFGIHFIHNSIIESIDYLRSRVGGSPLFLETLLRSLIHKKFIIKDQVCWKIDKKISDSDIPENLTEIIKDKLKNLFKDEGKRKILKVLSLLRIDPGLNIIKDIISLISPIASATVLHELENLEILESFNIENELYYRYCGSLIKDIIRNDIDNKDEISLFLANTLEKIVSNNDEYNEEIAYHYLQGKDIEKAVFYYEKCAKYAEDYFFNDKAIEYYGTILDLIDNKDIEKIIKLKLKTGSIKELIGLWDEALSLYSQCIELSKDIDNKSYLAKSYSDYGFMLNNKGKCEDAIAILEKAISIFEEIVDKKGLIRTLSNISKVYYDMSDYNKALKYLKYQYKLAEEIGDKKGIATARGNMGFVFSDLGEYSKALECYEEYKSIAEEKNDKKALSIALGNIGMTYYYLGQYSKALKYYEMDKKIAEEIGDKRGTGITYNNMGLVYKHLGQYTKTLECFDVYKNIAEELGDKKGVGIISNNMGNLYMISGEFQKAMESFQRKQEIAYEMGDKRGIGIAIGNIGILNFYMGRYEEALKSFQDQNVIFENIGFKRGFAISKSGLANVYYKLGDADEGLKYIEDAISLFEDQGIKDNDLIEVLMLTSEILLEKNEILKSKNMNQRAKELAMQSENVKYLNDCAIQDANIEFKKNNNKREYIKSLSRILENDINDEQKADIYYRLALQEGKEEYIKTAIKLFENLYKKIPRHQYKEQLEKLKALL